MILFDCKDTLISWNLKIFFTIFVWNLNFFFTIYVWILKFYFAFLYGFSSFFAPDYLNKSVCPSCDLASLNCLWEQGYSFYFLAQRVVVAQEFEVAG